MKARTRREMLLEAGRGLGALALASLLAEDGLIPGARAAAPGTRTQGSEPKAKAVIWLYMHGAPSHLDLFDYKPDLYKLAGQPVPASFGQIKATTDGGVGPILTTKRTWKQHGQSGAWVSDWYPNVAQHVDEMTFFKSCVTQGSTHITSMYRMNTGALVAGRPSLGAWVTYGLGAVGQNLPAFVVLTDNSGGIGEGRGVVGGGVNWGAGFLPATYQGTAFRQGETPILHLRPPREVGAEQQRGTLDYLKSVNEHHASLHPGDDELDARIQSYELAYRMQSAAPEAVNLGGESEATKRLYGLDDEASRQFGSNCLLARRLVERGVRFVQVYSGAANSWDAHKDIEGNHTNMCRITDRPIAGLLTDLKARGLLDSTLIVWGGEFGRTPYSQSGDGRDHNPWAFTTWMAGGGVKKGTVIGETDAIGLRAVDRPIDVHDLHATILNQLGLDHLSLTWLHNGRRERATVNGGRVVQEALA